MEKGQGEPVYQTATDFSRQLVTWLATVNKQPWENDTWPGKQWDRLAEWMCTSVCLQVDGWVGVAVGWGGGMHVGCVIAAEIRRNRLTR